MRLPTINKGLSIVNIMVAVYILLTPFFPSLLFWLQQRTTQPPSIITTAAAEENQSAPSDNRVIIPSILIDEQIFEGTSAALNNGIWRRPNASVPSSKDNTVLAGHVFTYDNPTGVFYNLHKVEPGDIVAVYWEGSEYLYTVNEKKEVSASAIEIEAPSDQAQLTLYTCTPLWNPVNRLVVIAKLTKVTELRQ